MVVAYRTDISTRDRSGAIAAVIAIHLLLLFMLLHLNGAGELPSADSVLKVLELEPAASTPAAASSPAEDAAEAEGEGGRFGAAEHQKSGNAGGSAQAADRHPANAADRFERNAARGDRR